MTTRQQKQFQSAAARRRADPPIWDVDGHPVALLEKADMAQIAPAIEALQNRVKPDGSGLVTYLALQEVETQLRDVIRSFVKPSSHDEWDQVAADQDVASMTAMIYAIVEEYTGVDPTKRASSTTPSATVGADSGDGALDAEYSTASDSMQPTS